MKTSGIRTQTGSGSALFDAVFRIRILESWPKRPGSITKHNYLVPPPGFAGEGRELELAGDNSLHREVRALRDLTRSVYANHHLMDR